jgi:hypothetical protein
MPPILCEKEDSPDEEDESVGVSCISLLAEESMYSIGSFSLLFLTSLLEEDSFEEDPSSSAEGGGGGDTFPRYSGWSFCCELTRVLDITNKITIELMK